MRKLQRICVFIVTLSIVLGCVAFANGNTTLSQTMNENNYYEITTNDVLNTYGETVIKLPINFKDVKIDGVSIDRDGKFALVKTSIDKDEITVNTVEDLVHDATYNIRIYTKDGKRYVMPIKAKDNLNVNPKKNNLVRISAKPSKGFNFPYYLYIPSGAFTNKDTMHLLVEGNNGYASDSFIIHDTSAKDIITNKNGLKYYADSLNVPSLVPIFPRFADHMNTPYLRFLDRKSLLTDDEQIKRVDLQLTAMIKDAQNILSNLGIEVESKVSLVGLSTSAKFAQRYALLQPHMVKTMVVGYTASITSFPFSEYKGTKLRYPIGTADYKEITGTEFDVEEYKKIAQFHYMGDRDTNDATQFRDCYEEEDAQTIWRLFGEDQLNGRFENTEKALKEMGFGDRIQFHMYKDLRHEKTPNTIDDILKFLKANNGEEFNRIKPHEYGRSGH